MTAQDYADDEGITYVAIPAGACPGGGVRTSVAYCVRAREAYLWEMAAGRLVFPAGGERYPNGQLPFSLRLLLEKHKGGNGGPQ